MDQLTTLSRAGTLNQFVDFALKILTTGHQLYSGSIASLSAYEELKCVARDLSGLAKRLSHAPRYDAVSGTFQGGAVLEDICKECEAVVQDLMDHLRTLKMQVKKGPLKGFRPALKATWAQKDLEALIQNLQGVRKSLDSWLLDIR